MARAKEKTVSTADGLMIPVRCSFTKLVAPGKLKAHPKNPNQHPERQVELLSEIIKANAWRAPVVVSDLSGYVTKGHCRLAAALLLKAKTIPVDVQHYESEAQEMADLIADNRIAELAFMDQDLLRNALDELEKIGGNLAAAGYDKTAARILRGLRKQAASKVVNPKWEVIVECKSEKQQKSLYEEMIEKGFACRLLTF